MNIKTQMNLIKSVIDGDGDFHKSCKKFREILKKDKKTLDFNSPSDVNYSS